MKHLYNWDIVGHGRVIAGLEKDIVQKNVSHAYLFEGPEGVGKFTVAKTMAKILQCENNFCGDCAACREIEKGCHADTIEKVDDGESIKIEGIRGILASLHMSKNSPRRIFLAQNIERMTLESANAILKTLEDPPGDVVFLLTTSRLKEILPTIISRVRLCNFQRLPENEMSEFMRNLYPLMEDDLLGQISELAMGRPGRARELMDNPAVFEDVKKMYGDIGLFVKKPDMANQFGYVSRLVKQAKDGENNKLIRDFLDIFTAVLRKKLLADAGETASAGGEAGLAADAAARKRTIALIKEIQDAHDLFKRNVNNRLILENLILNLC
jgi:hypothetical protein